MPIAPRRFQPTGHKPARSGGHPSRDAGDDHYELLNCERWRRLRLAYLSENPLCEMCGGGNETGKTDMHVDHRISRRERPDLAFEWSNLRALCGSCHSKHEGWRAAMKVK